MPPKPSAARVSTNVQIGEHPLEPAETPLAYSREYASDGEHKVHDRAALSSARGPVMNDNGSRMSQQVNRWTRRIRGT